MKTSILNSKTNYTVLGIVTLLTFCIVLSYFPGGFLFPTIDKVVVSFFNLFTNSEFIGCFFHSILTLTISLMISFVLAMILSFIHIANSKIDWFFKPFLVFLKCAPIAIIALYIFLIGGPNQDPYFLVFATTFPLMMEAFISSIDEIPLSIKSELKITNVNLFTKYFKVYLPLIFPYLAMSFIMTFGLGLKVTIMGEYLMNSPSSLGEFIYTIKTTLDIELLLSVLLFCVLFTILLEIIAKIIFKKIHFKIFKIKNN